MWAGRFLSVIWNCVSFTSNKYMLILSVIASHARPTPQYYKKSGKAWSIRWCNWTRFGTYAVTYLRLLAHVVEAQSAPCWHSSRNYCSKTACVTPPKYTVKPGKSPMVSYCHTHCLLVIGHCKLVSFWVQACIRFEFSIVPVLADHQNRVRSDAPLNKSLFPLSWPVLVHSQCTQLARGRVGGDT